MMTLVNGYVLILESSSETDYEHYYKEPGYQKINPLEGRQFDYGGSDGFVFVSVELDDTLIADNHKVPSNTNVIVTKGGTLRQAMEGQYWIDRGGINQALIPCPDQYDDSD